jgi:hypothetical protein
MDKIYKQKSLIHHCVSNFSMPKDIINHNETPNPHLQKETNN